MVYRMVVCKGDNMKRYINRRMLDKTIKQLIRTFKGWDIEFDIEKKGEDVKSIRIDITYNERYKRAE